MSSKIRNLQPKALWNNFVNLNAIPRPSKKEDKVREFMVDFGNNIGLQTIVDPVGNVIIKKPATKGMENCKTVVLQSHLDMVCQKNNDTEFDFDTQGINMYIAGDWVTADGTTLGADNGLGVAAIMTVLASKEIIHPDLEALFTIDEETGMTGALGLLAGYLDGEILLNLDTEDDDEIAIGCAGGIDITASKSYDLSKVNDKACAFEISVKGLLGGHSGMDIHKGLGNSNKIMNRILFSLKDKILIAEINGGSLRNAIPRESNATIVCDNAKIVQELFEHIRDEIIEEYKNIEKHLVIVMDSVALPETTLSKTQQDILLKSVYSIHHGVFRMSLDMDGLVETSNNLARVLVKDGKVEILCLTRSATDIGKTDLTNQIQSGLQLGGFKVVMGGSYPGWKPNAESKILKVLQEVYQNLFNEQPKIIAYHAGLECGILGTNYPAMDMISFGPNIKRAHSPDEKVCISSVQKFWKYLLEILENTPVR